MHSFSDLLRWYNKKHVVTTLGAMKKMIQFSHDNGIDMLKLGCTLSNLAETCRYSSTSPNFYPFLDGDNELLKKFGKI